MGIRIEPYTPEQESAVRDLNERLRAGGCAFRFPESSRSRWLPRDGDPALFEEFFVARENGKVRGGFILKQQPFWLSGTSSTVGCLYLPLSEGSVDPRYNRVGIQLLGDARRRQPLLFSLGMGGFHHPYPRMLAAAGWTLSSVPFYFRVNHPRAFWKNIRHLRRHPAGRLAADLLAYTGLGSLGLAGAQWLAARRHRSHPSAELVDEFGPWADDVWLASRDEYSLAAVRSRRFLNRLYPRNVEKFLKLEVGVEGEVVGWAVVLDTSMHRHKHFGQMRVGSIIDSFARAGSERDVIGAATEFLERRGVDLIVTNQSHVAWGAACRHAGFLRGPSNFGFAASPKLAAQLAPFTDRVRRIHVNRGDGEGPSHL